MKIRKFTWFILVILAVFPLSADDPVVQPRFRDFHFSGFPWRVKASGDYPIGPGPNYWSNAPESVWVDDRGMHLTVQQIDGVWYSTEVFVRRPLGYGTYTFVIDSDIASYDRNIVAGFFTWDNHPAEHNREIDIEFASWGQPGGTKGHFIVQPPVYPERMDVFDPGMKGTFSTHRFIWTPDGVEFFSYHGAVDPDDPASSRNLMRKWEFTGTPPTPGNARFRINLWLFQGEPPLNEGASLIVRSFSFLPWE